MLKNAINSLSALILVVSSAPTLAQSAETDSVAALATQKITDAAIANRYTLTQDGNRFSGPAWEKLLEEGRNAQFFLIGEEHGVAENPKLSAALFAELAKSGYTKIVIETSPTMARLLDDAASDNGVGGLQKLFAEPGGEPAFFGMKEEAEFVAQARAALADKNSLFWGVDYEVTGDRQLIKRLKQKQKPDAAVAVLDKLASESGALWEKHAATGGPQHIFSFAGDPQIVRDLRAAWPDRDNETSAILDTLEETLEINRLYLNGQNWQSNQRRADLIRANFLRHWQAEQVDGRPPRLMAKMGASHLVRGRSYTEAFDLGALLPELAAMEGGHSFNVMVLPGKGSLTAVFDPTNFSFKAAPAKDGYAKGIEPVLDAAMQDQFTLIDLRPLRSVIRPGKMQNDQNLVRLIFGYDMLLVMSGSTASSELIHD
jgi:hypothetical protein|tara:strand:+ start:5930 stop:7216 length:1287 start_codon:yes stop_codon:yes gene_type:complete